MRSFWLELGVVLILLLSSMLAVCRSRRIPLIRCSSGERGWRLRAAKSGRLKLVLCFSVFQLWDDNITLTFLRARRTRRLCCERAYESLWNSQVLGRSGLVIERHEAIPLWRGAAADALKRKLTA